MFLVISSMGFSQELLINGDFETGDGTGWIGNAVNVVTEMGNSYNAADVTTAGQPFTVNLSQVESMTSGTTYTFSFDAFSDGNRTMVVGIGLNEAPWTAVVETINLTAVSQNFTFDMTANFTSANSRVIFDMGADTGFVGIDNVSLIEVMATCMDGMQNGDEEGVDCGGANCPPCMIPEPTTAPPTPPARAESDVISIYGDAYTTPPAVGLINVPWDAPTEFTEQNYAGNNVLKADIGTFLGSSLGAVVDASAMTHFHMDFWIADGFTPGQVFNTKWSNHTGGAGETDAGENTYVVGATDSQQWVSLDIPLTDFVNVAGGGIANREALTEFLITVSGTIDLAYIDNIYFHNNMTLSTDTFEVNTFNVFPNPSKSSWTIQATQIINTIELYNSLGKKVFESIENNNIAEINAVNLATGLYFAKISSDSGIQSIKLLKE